MTFQILLLPAPQGQLSKTKLITTARAVKRSLALAEEAGLNRTRSGGGGAAPHALEMSNDWTVIAESPLFSTTRAQDTGSFLTTGRNTGN
jgi:hypothetical protein